MNFNTKSLVLLTFVLLLDPYTSNSQELSSDCTINDWRKSTGSCKSIRDCGSALSELRSGVTPTLCRVQNTKGVCCPTTPRISELMCEKYKEVLRESDGPTPLLPLDFLQDRPKEIHCNKLVNKLIVGGREAQQDEFPHMAALGWGNDVKNLEYRCGGTLISENFILTAAHCIETRSGKPSYVLLGDIRLSSALVARRTIVKIAEYIKHPEYRKPLTYNDIALLRLENPVNLSRSVLPACLPQPVHRLENRLQMSTTGWGQLGTADNPSDILQAVNLTRFGLNECNDFFKDQPERVLKYPKGILRSQICAGDRARSKDSCRGDSGGPLTVTSDRLRCVFYVVGITSFGSSICGIQPGVYTNVQSYLDFIERTVWPTAGVSFR